MLTIQGLSYRYGRRGTPVLNGVDLTLARGEIGILLGRNGSGKTTLFRNILGLCTPDSGSIRLDGLEMTSLSPRRRARYIACVPQDICFGALTVWAGSPASAFRPAPRTMRRHRRYWRSWVSPPSPAGT